MSKDRTVWCDRGWFTTYYGFCPSEAAWKREMKRLKVESPPPYPDSDARCTQFHCEGKSTVLVTLNERLDGECPTGLVGLLVHEAVHVWQSVCEDMGEDAPGREVEAYAIQNITMNLLAAYAKTRGETVKWPQ